MKKVIPLIIGFSFLVAFGAAWADDSEIVHTVKKGDTLWDISNKYLSTPWKWPLIWAENEKITNPHLIYPGDKVVILSQDGKISVKIIPADETAVERVFGIDQLAGIKGKSILLSPEYSILIYSDKPLKTKGTVAAKVDVGTLSTTDEKILVRGYADIKPGKGLVIKSLDKEIMIDDEICGYFYRIIALAKVDSVEKGIATCTVTYSYQEINEEDLVDDDISRVQPVTIIPSENKKVKYAKIIDTWYYASGGGEGDVVFIDRGSADGIKQGNVLNIYKDIPVKDGRAVKDIGAYAGSAVIIQTIKNSAIALITYSNMYIENEGFYLSGK